MFSPERCAWTCGPRELQARQSVPCDMASMPANFGRKRAREDDPAARRARKPRSLDRTKVLRHFAACLNSFAPRPCRRNLTHHSHARQKECFLSRNATHFHPNFRFGAQFELCLILARGPNLSSPNPKFRPGAQLEFPERTQFELPEPKF